MRTVDEVQDSHVEWVREQLLNTDARLVLAVLLGSAASVAQAVRSSKAQSLNDITGQFQCALDFALTPPAEPVKVIYVNGDTPVKPS